MLAKELIDRLEREGLLDQEIIEALREQLAQTGARVTPEAIAKLLVDNGQLTRFQATKLIGKLRSSDPAGDEAEIVEAVVEEDELLTFDDDGTADVFEAEPAEAVAVDAIPIEAEPVAAVPVEAVAVAAEPVGDGRDDAMAEIPPDRPRSTRGGRPSKPENKSVWDSFKVYGYVGIIGFLLLSGGGLFWILSRGNADDVIKIADEKYDTGSFQPAQDAYQGFLATFGEENQYSSRARTRITMAELFRAETMTDPTAASDLAREKLPSIVDEEGMNLERGNLAQLLVDIAKNIADAASGASETSEKQRLLGRLDEHQELIDNPNYMLGSMKKTLAGQLLELSETRNRVRREISRNIRLDETVTAMETALSDNETKKSYDERDQLLRDFPELQDDPRLQTLIESASDIQQTLVKQSTKLPKVSVEPLEEESIRSIVLTTRVGESIPGLEEENYFLRAGGSVLAFSAADGRLLWRKFTGYGEDHTPLRLDDGTSVLLSDVRSHEVRRVDGPTGDLVWRTKVGEPFSEPSVGRDTVLISTRSGRMLALDADTGESKWVAEIPQGLDTAPGIDDTLGKVYQTGNHSNLYLLNARDGKCLQSFYLGHDEGTIVVPPVPLLGHLFVIENTGADFALVHVLKVDDQGENLKVAQPPFRLTGNVKVRPVLQKRRIILLTDLGEVTVLDVELTAERQQVAKVAGEVASYEAPTATQMAVGRGQMWITGTRIGRYELQINTGRVVMDWTKNEGDTFLGRPLSLEDTLIHARQLRDTASIRVMATDPKSGGVLWKTDVGVPVAMIQPSPSGGFHVVTSGGALFELDRQALEDGSTQGPVENPGENGIALRFEDPIRVNETVRVLLNQASPAETMVYDPGRRNQKLRKVQMNLTDGVPAGRGVFAGGGLLLPVDNGRVVLANYQTGSMLGSPFQPASNPTETVKWTNPVTLSDDPDQVILADDRNKVYRLRAGDQVRELASADLETPMIDRIAMVGSVVIGATAGPAADFVVGLDAGGLELAFKTLLEGRVVWGPVSAPSGAAPRALLMTNDGVLRAYDQSGKQVFQTSLPWEGTPIDEILSINDRWVLCGREGGIVTLGPGTGAVLGSFDLGQPISAAPFPVGSRLLVPGAEGVIYIISTPGGE
ncbi:MAG: PQQ-binding-like beta-propeller repeat protein [Planctomycetota bacterium]